MRRGVGDGGWCLDGWLVIESAGRTDNGDSRMGRQGGRAGRSEGLTDWKVTGWEVLVFQVFQLYWGD